MAFFVSKNELLDRLLKEEQMVRIEMVRRSSPIWAVLGLSHDAFEGSIVQYMVDHTRPPNDDIRAMLEAEREGMEDRAMLLQAKWSEEQAKRAVVVEEPETAIHLILGNYPLEPTEYEWRGDGGLLFRSYCGKNVETAYGRDALHPNDWTWRPFITCLDCLIKQREETMSSLRDNPLREYLFSIRQKARLWLKKRDPRDTLQHFLP